MSGKNVENQTYFHQIRDFFEWGNTVLEKPEYKIQTQVPSAGRWAT